MKTRIAFVLLALLALAGCTSGGGMTSPLMVSSAPALYAAPTLGVWADAGLRVVGITPGSAAEMDGVQMGDILLDLTWIPSDALPYIQVEPGEVAIMDSSFPPGSVITGGIVVTPTIDGTPVVRFGSPLMSDGGIPLAVVPLTPVASYVEKEPVPFTATERIGTLVGIGVPLKLRLLRGGQEIELTITPAGARPLPTLPSGEIMPTPTPLAEPEYYF